MRKVFVLIRDKLGDSVIAFQALSVYRSAHPADEITVMVHAHYLPIFAAEKGYRFLPYRSSMQAMAWAILQRLSLRRFDDVLVLRGFGKKVARMAKLLNAERRIHALNRFPEVFADSPMALPRVVTEAESIIAPSLRGVRVLDSELPEPDRLLLPGLIRRYRKKRNTVVICPVSDEPRKNLSRDDVERILPVVQARYPGATIRILVRHSGEGGFVSGRFHSAEVRAFGSIEPLLQLLGEAIAYFGCDTGLYHVAAAMGLHSTVAFGPTQPYKVLQPAQEVEVIRLESLGQSHCDNKACTDPICIHTALAKWAGSEVENPLWPEACPLRDSDGRLVPGVEAIPHLENVE